MIAHRFNDSCTYCTYVHLFASCWLQNDQICCRGHHPIPGSTRRGTSIFCSPRNHRIIDIDSLAQQWAAILRANPEIGESTTKPCFLPPMQELGGFAGGRCDVMAQVFGTVQVNGAGAVLCPSSAIRYFRPTWLPKMCRNTRSFAAPVGHTSAIEDVGVRFGTGIPPLVAT